MDRIWLLQLLAVFVVFQISCAQRDQPLCLDRSCYPATGNLLVGRERYLRASSTCGLRGPERYCVVADVRDVKKCFECDSRRPWTETNQISHNITNIVATFSKDRLRRWWQAVNGAENVTIQLDLDAEFHFTHLIITFKTFRPKAMYIERSLDFGKTWMPYRYFAEDCKKHFPSIRTGPITNMSETICEEKYSNVLPANLGEVVFKVLPPLRIDDPYSQEVQNLLKLTNLRIILKELHTLGDDLLDQRKEINEKYYFAIYDMVVRGSCSCYGHASRCVPSNAEDWNVENMVHSKCECTHNTKGKNCDQCADFYNDRPWMPARGKETNECKMCECNRHASSCHFDPAVYHSRGNVSGGVCDNCMHNTDGLNCELCKSHFFQDPARDLRDPMICQPCDCDPLGTQNNGECDMRDDPENGLQAGRCKCKANVGGTRCEKCKSGFWDLSEHGCIKCECNTLGTYSNEGCDQGTGECQCKRFVTGTNCDQCLPEYWGLSKDPEGCFQCDCDTGGSYDNQCDSNSGQCKCRTGIQGRRCNQTIPGFFIPNVDHLRYEAEYATGTGNTQVVIREIAPGYPITWTGVGFMRAHEGDSITFEVSDVPYSMNYEILIRYESQMPREWRDVRVAVERPTVPDPDGPCGNRIPQDDYTQAVLSSATRHHLLAPTICFEKSKTYNVRLDFERYQPDDDTPTANILIDSIALIPVIQELPIQIGATPFPQDLLISCNLNELEVYLPRNISELCSQIYFSIGAALQQQALQCDCDPTGSESSICDQLGGQCRCKPNVGGRRCDRCLPATYGFGPLGCQLCNCNAQGSRDNFCDALTGACLCMGNINGRACDRCERGLYGFPNCKRCVCNGHADECEDKTGTCISCRDRTHGQTCDQCLSGYYGDPKLGSGIPCQPCMCPGGAGSLTQHASLCRLDPLNKSMKCLCPAQFAGDRCEKCAENHFGNPTEANGTCTSCLAKCNYNIDMDIPASCEPATGKCIKCQYNSAGDRCEFCAEGYFGSAPDHNCLACECHPFGTQRTHEEVPLPCDRTSGQCTCLPNVIGKSCDQCAINHWRIASGTGCDECACDPEGSLSTQCNEFDGQCECIPGRGGRKCDECVTLNWGDPKVECFECNCNPDGSEHLQCNSKTGQCPCLPGITGQTCDQCDRGTTGDLPNCVACGECFDSWDLILKQLRVKTDALLAQVNITKNEGAVGAYDDDFMAMEQQLADVKKIVDGFNQTAADMTSIQTSLDEIRKLLEKADVTLKNLTANFKTANEDLTRAETDRAVLLASILDLKNYLNQQKKAVDALIQEDINGAFNTIKTNEKLSKDALGRAEGTEQLIEEVDVYKTQTEALLLSSEQEFNTRLGESEKSISDASLRIGNITSTLKLNINKEVCDQRNSLTEDQFCDAACGGGGCSSCGAGESCTEGAQGKAKAAQKVAERAQNITAGKLQQSLLELEKLSAASLAADNAHNRSKEAHTIARSVMQRAQNGSLDVKIILKKIVEFLDLDMAKPEEVQQVADNVLSLSIPMSQEQIELLAQQINETIQNLTNIDAILNETAADLATTENLKQRADNASEAAANILNQVTELNKRLFDARRAQNNSQAAIEKALGDISQTRDTVTIIGNVTTVAIKKAAELMSVAQRLYDKAKNVSTKSTDTQLNLEKAEAQAKQAKNSAAQAALKEAQIRASYGGVSENITKQYNASLYARNRSEQLLKRATNLASDLSSKRSTLDNMGKQLVDNENQIEDLSKQIETLKERMDNYLEILRKRESFHTACERVDSVNSLSP